MLGFPSEEEHSTLTFFVLLLPSILPCVACAHTNYTQLSITALDFSQVKTEEHLICLTPNGCRYLQMYKEGFLVALSQPSWRLPSTGDLSPLIKQADLPLAGFAVRLLLLGSDSTTLPNTSWESLFKMVPFRTVEWWNIYLKTWENNAITEKHFLSPE